MRGRKGTYVPRGDQWRLDGTNLQYALGHSFGEELKCAYCYESWENHQREPRECLVRQQLDRLVGVAEHEALVENDSAV